MKKLLLIQTQLKVLKTIWNSFSKFYYRNTESILKAVKPLLEEHNCVLKLTDEMICLGDRYYVKATATIKDLDSNESESATANARESLTKKGMDESQITGSASSYARKNALGGLFLLDDNKDSDNEMKDEEKELEKHKADRNYKNLRILEIINGTPITLGQVKSRIDKEFGKYIELNDLTDEQFLKITQILYKNLDSLMDE